MSIIYARNNTAPGSGSVPCCARVDRQSAALRWLWIMALMILAAVRAAAEPDSPEGVGVACDSTSLVCAEKLCEASPDTSLLVRQMPATWRYEQKFFQPAPTDDRWWSTFNDPTLVELIRRAVANNYDVQASARRIELARQTQRATKAGYYPTVSITGGFNDDMTSTAIHGEHSHEEHVSYFQLGLSVNWEIDVFGRIRAQLKADKANYEASMADYDATLVSLCANVAKAYFQLRLAQAQVDVAERNVEVVEKQKTLADARYEAGLRPLLDVVQARLSVSQTRATLPQLRANALTAINQLSILLGEYPSALDALLAPQPLPTPPPPGEAPDPEALLRRRPDIVAAEKQLAATAAQIGIAKKDFLPTLSFTGEVGTQNRSLNHLFTNSSYFFSLYPTLSWTIFEGMARNVKLAQARLNMEIEIDNYNSTVMTAVAEVNNAFVSWQSLCDQLIYQEILLKDARKQLELQTDRYTQGLASFGDISGAQATVLTYENSLVSIQASQLAALVTLYTALGGGY